MFGIAVIPAPAAQTFRSALRIAAAIMSGKRRPRVLEQENPGKVEATPFKVVISTKQRQGFKMAGRHMLVRRGLHHVSLGHGTGETVFSRLQAY